MIFMILCAIEFLTLQNSLLWFLLSPVDSVSIISRHLFALSYIIFTCTCQSRSLLRITFCLNVTKSSFSFFTCYAVTPNVIQIFMVEIFTCLQIIFILSCSFHFPIVAYLMTLFYAVSLLI